MKMTRATPSDAVRTAILLGSVGLAASAANAGGGTATSEPAARSGNLASLQKAGVLYINIQTGERSLTLYEGSGKAADAWLADPAQVALRSGVALFDYWMSIGDNPCWDDPRADGFGFNMDATTDPTAGITQPVVAWDYGDMPFDSKITGVLINTAILATESTDSNADGVPDSGIDTVGVYYDALSEAQRSSNTPPTAAVRIESIPGNRGEVSNGFSSYDLVLDFGGDWFELGDSDGENLGALWLPGANSGEDVVATRTEDDGKVWTAPADGLADFQYLQYYTQHGSDAKVTADSTFIGFGVPEGHLEFTTYTTPDLVVITTASGATTTVTTVVTLTATTLVPDALPQGQGVFESIGVGSLGPGGDTTNIDSTIAGCCFWFGGLDCVGFLDQVVEEPPYNATWYEFTPYTQLAHAFFSDSSSFDPCSNIDFNNDGVLDNGDIGLFITAKFAQDLSISDVNGDGVCDNGDIGAFVQIFFSCTG